MKPRIIALTVLVVSLGGPAWAQGPYVRPNPNPNNPYARPLFSPYLNLVRTNNPAINAGINYAGIVRPEFQTFSDIGQLQRQVSSLETTVTAGPEGTGLVTGHPVLFQNYGHFYPAAGAPGSALGRRPGVGATATTSFPQGQATAPTAGRAPAPKK
jgi:hypothetical protein